MNAVLQGVVQIRGTATITGFHRYKLEYCLEGTCPQQGQWPLLSKEEFFAPVFDGVLMEWDTRTVPPGIYRLRLVVVKQDGNYYTPEPEVRVIVAAQR